MFPATANFENSEERPYLEYTFAAAKDGTYHVQFHMSATTPVTFEPKQYIGYSVNGGAVQVVNTVHEENRPFFGSEQWYAEGFANVKLTEAVILCHAGGQHTALLCGQPGHHSGKDRALAGRHHPAGILPWPAGELPLLTQPRPA